MNKLSLRFRITFLYAVSFLLIAAVLFTTVHLIFKEVLLSNTQNLLKAYSIQVTSAIEVENGNIRFDESMAPDDQDIYFQITDRLNNVVYSRVMNEQVDRSPADFGHFRTLDGFLLYDRQILDENNAVGWVRTVISIENINETLNSLLLIYLLSIPVILIITVLMGYYLSKKFLKPIDRITLTAQAIGRGDLSKRLNMKASNDEVGRLSSTFDEMLERLEVAFKKEKQFTSDASHELRTPVAVITAYAEDAVLTGHSPQDHKDAFNVILKESRKMSSIISHLLMLTRGDDRKYKLVQEKVNLTQLLRDVISEEKNRTWSNAVSISIDAHEDVIIHADQTLLTRLFLNIMENAIKYNKENGFVNVFVGRNEDMAMVVIEDGGVGIPEKDIPYLFNRFYRAEHTLDFEGTGLGLAIAKWIVELHNGSIDIKSHIGSGTTVTVVLPLFLPNK